jgi:hypothetical protein
MRIGIIVRSDNTGLGFQTKELVDMLKPDKVMLIDYSTFNGNQQHPEWYKDYDCLRVANGMPNGKSILRFFEDLDVVISCELFYRDNLPSMARRLGIKTVLQYNFELFGNLQNPALPLPDLLLAPSMWNIETVEQMFGTEAAIAYLPPPTNPETFKNAKEINMSKTHNRLLHIGGKPASKDRNGTLALISAIPHCKTNFELVIRSQKPLTLRNLDPRITVEISNIESREEMYTGFDAMILPRRYAGLCLPMNEALLSGLPVFMTDISPNNFILPKEWLVKSEEIGMVNTKKPVAVYESNPKLLARMIDAYILSDNKLEQKERAYQIGFENFSPEVLKPKYLDILGK